jgi:hypothetical protein
MLELMKSLIIRFRYPVSIPQDVADALGVHITNRYSAQELVDTLMNQDLKPTRLARLMPRIIAEDVFKAALKEKFHLKTICSFYLNNVRLVFILEFDHDSQLRRVYMNHKEIKLRNANEYPLIS